MHRGADEKEEADEDIIEEGDNDTIKEDDKGDKTTGEAEEEEQVIPRYYLIVKQDEVDEETETEDEEETEDSSEEEEEGDKGDTKKGDKGNDNGNGPLRRSPRLAIGATVRYF